MVDRVDHAELPQDLTNIGIYRILPAHSLQRPAANSCLLTTISSPTDAFVENRKARYDYETLETFDGGIVLTGQEVKSVRNGGAHFMGAHVGFEQGALWLKGARIAPYAKAGRLEGYVPERPRKILLRKAELLRLAGKTQQKGLTLVPFSLYPRGRHIKLRFGLCRGRKAHDKKEKLKERDISREVTRGDDED